MGRKPGAQNQGGRPSKFTSINLEQVRKLASKGFTDEEMADFFGVVIKTWHNWKKEHPEFFEQLKDWKAAADEKVERSLFERATGYQHPDTEFFNNKGVIISQETVKYYPPDPTAAIFWLKNRRPGDWKDKQEVQHSGQLIIVDVPDQD